MAVKHAFTSAVADGADATKVRPTNWNAAHTVEDGLVGTPGIAFTNDPNTGLYLSAADTLDVAVGGVRGLQITTTALGVNYLDFAPAIATASPTITAEGTDTNIGISLVPKGTGGVVGPVGAVGTPAFTFTGDVDTGVYRIGADNLGIAVGGVKQVDIAASVTSITGSLSIGTTPATAGTIRIPNAGTIEGRNAANTANLQLLTITTGNVLQLYDNTNNALRNAITRTADATGHLAANQVTWTV